jgi:hypothetical protein
MTDAGCRLVGHERGSVRDARLHRDGSWIGVGLWLGLRHRRGVAFGSVEP